MTQSTLDRAVARATGEKLSTIQNRGFSIADPETVCFDPEPADSFAGLVDWDELDAERFTIFPARQYLQRMAA